MGTRIKLLSLLLCLGVLGFLSAPAFSVEEAPTEKRVMHYAADLPETKEAALGLLTEKQDATAVILDKAELAAADLEAVHEISYSLEAAIDKFIELEGDRNEDLDAVDEAVQALHYASENYEAAQTREWFAKLETAVAALGQKKEIVKLEKKDFYEIIIKDHKFTPEELTVPAGEKIKLKVHNQDETAEEFESHDLNREKIIKGGKTATIFISPMKPGKYHYFGEFNMDTANGYIIAE